jgi:hypothetical protein
MQESPKHSQDDNHFESYSSTKVSNFWDKRVSNNVIQISPNIPLEGF